MKRRLAVATLLLAVSALPAMAQRPARQLQRGNPDARAPGGRGNRAELEGEVRRRFARLVRERVGLNDEQMGKLGPMTQRYEQQRQQLQRDERDTRESLRGIILGDAPADSAKIEALIERMKDVQRRRVQMMEAEDKELATFMSPLQRAKLLALQEQVRRQLEQMRPPPGAPFDRPPPA